MIFHSLTFARSRGKIENRGTLRMLMNDKIMFNCYYCINSAKYCENEENIGALYFKTSSHFPTRVKIMHDSGPVQILIILHVLAWRLVTSIVKRRASAARAHENSLINTRHFSLFLHCN